MVEHDSLFEHDSQQCLSATRQQLHPNQWTVAFDLDSDISCHTKLRFLIPLRLLNITSLVLSDGWAHENIIVKMDAISQELICLIIFDKYHYNPSEYNQYQMNYNINII